MKRHRDHVAEGGQLDLLYAMYAAENVRAAWHVLNEEERAGVIDYITGGRKLADPKEPGA